MNSSCRLSMIQVAIVQWLAPLLWSSSQGFLMPKSAHQSMWISSPQPLNKHFDELKKWKMAHQVWCACL